MNIKVLNTDFNVTPAEATKMAQEIHNQIDENGELNEPAIVEELCETFGDVFEAWLINHIDWQEILDADQDARDFIEEREEAAKGQY